MQGFLVRTAIAAVGLALAGALVPGIVFDGSASMLIAALLLSFVNAIVRPVVVILTLPLTVLTLGLFLWVINGLMLLLVASLLGGFGVEGLLSAMFGSLIVGLTSWIGSMMIGPRGRVEVLAFRSQ